jgi:hypothetical protein
MWGGEREEKEEEFFNHCKNDLKRHAHTLSGDAGADLKSRVETRGGKAAWRFIDKRFIDKKLKKYTQFLYALPRASTWMALMVEPPRAPTSLSRPIASLPKLKAPLCTRSHLAAVRWLVPVCSAS